MVFGGLVYCLRFISCWLVVEMAGCAGTALRIELIFELL
jgi:hypothetical protein